MVGGGVRFVRSGLDAHQFGVGFVLVAWVIGGEYRVVRFAGPLMVSGSCFTVALRRGVQVLFIV